MSSKKQETPKLQQTDPFAFANKLLGCKEELDAEVFFVSKNFVPYRANLSSAVQVQTVALFIDPFLEAMFEGSEHGMVVRDIDTPPDRYILPRVGLDDVPYASEIIQWLDGKHTIDAFSSGDVSFKNIKAMAVRFSLSTDPSVKFYVVRSLNSQVVGTTGKFWQVDGEVVNTLRTDIAFKVPADNQIVVIGNDMFVFNVSKFEKLFNYNNTKLKQADIKAKEFEKHYKISVPSGLVGIENFLRESPTLLNKFLKTDITLMDQEKVLDVSDEMKLDLMMDDVGAIILMEKKDLGVMLDIINDNYYESGATGHHYVAKSKKMIEDEK